MWLVTRGIEKQVKIKGLKENVSCSHPKEAEESGRFLPIGQHIYWNQFKNRKFTDSKNTAQSRLKCPNTIGAKSSLVLLKQIEFTVVLVI